MERSGGEEVLEELGGEVRGRGVRRGWWRGTGRKGEWEEDERGIYEVSLF